MGVGEATNEEGDDRMRKIVTRFSDSGHVKDNYIVVLIRVREDKEEDVPPSGPGLSYCSNTAPWQRYGSALYVPYGINYSAKANPCTLLDVTELIGMANCDLPTSSHNIRTHGGRTYVYYHLTYPFMGKRFTSFRTNLQVL